MELKQRQKILFMICKSLLLV